MTQDAGDPVIGDGDTGDVALRAINASLAAARTLHSGATAPTNQEPFQLWVDTDFAGTGSAVLRQRNAADDYWSALWPVGTTQLGGPVNCQTNSVVDASYDMPTLIGAGGDPAELAKNTQVIHATAATANRTITLPNASTRNGGRILIHRPAADVGTFELIVTADAIDGATANQFRLQPAETVELIAIAGVYHVVRFRGLRVKTITSGPYAPEQWDQVLLCDATSGSFSVTLPSASQRRGQELIFKKTTAANTVTLTGTIDATVNTALTTQWTFRRITSNGSGWFIIA